MMDLSSYDHIVYRNFATAHPSQDLLDDLIPEPSGQAILTPYYYSRSIHDAPSPTFQTPVERILERSVKDVIQAEIDSKFKPDTWYTSRFSDGSWAVLYTAEHEETALCEAVYHLRNFYREELTQKMGLSIDRRVISLHIKSTACADLSERTDLDLNALTSTDSSGYPYCQALAKTSRANGAALLRTPSARHAGGICVPIFDTASIAHDHGHLKYLKLVLTASDTQVFEEV